ncbi:MAG: hypothetical protein R3358_10570 [Woeseiaceae bacterium]|nr:hypothetical protein [Woeseiaceae bacterium]
MIRKRSLFSILLLFCLTLSATDLPARGIDDRLWIQMESENFTVYSTLSERRTYNLLVHLETLRGVFVSFFGYSSHHDQKPTQILVLGRHSDYRNLGLPADSAGIFTSNLRNNTIVIGETLSLDESQVIMHEYIHYLARVTNRIPFPKWWDEGYAEFASATRMTETTFDMGLPLQQRARTLRNTTWLPWEDILSGTYRERWFGFGTASFYAQSWLLVHFLQTRRAEVSVDDSWAIYREAIENGADSIEAFERSFGLSVEQLAEQLDAYAASGRLQYWKIPLEQLSVRVDAQADGMRKREVQVQLGQLALANGDGAAAHAWFDKAIRGRSRDPAAFAGRGTALMLMKRYEDAQADFERAREMDPDNVLTLIDYARFELDNASRAGDAASEEIHLQAAESLLQRALEVGGANVEAETYLASIWLARDPTSGDAVSLLEGVVERSPTDQIPTIMLADALRETGRCDEAVSLARLVVHFSHGRGDFAKMAESLIAGIDAGNCGTTD